MVFIQVSLQRYEHHRSLCDLFNRAACTEVCVTYLIGLQSSAHTQRNIIVFTHYRRLLRLTLVIKTLFCYIFHQKKRPAALPY